MNIINNGKLHSLETSSNAEFKAMTELPICPYKTGKKHQECWPDNLFSKTEYCEKCPDFWKNYNTIVYDSILKAEQDPKSNIHLIRKECRRDSGQYVYFCKENPVLLLGATTTIEDYYWLYIDENLKLGCSSCVGGYNKVTRVEDCCMLGELDDLRFNNPDKLMEIINEQLSQWKYDKLITKIKIS